MSATDKERYREARAAGIAQHGDNVNDEAPWQASLHCIKSLTAFL